MKMRVILRNAIAAHLLGVIGGVLWFVAGTSCIAAQAPPGNSETGQRISDSNQRYWVEEVARGLRSPETMAWLPNGDMLIAEKHGTLRILRAHGGLDPVPIRGVPAVCEGSTDGLKDMALDPDFGTKRLVYLSLCEGSGKHRHAAVYRARYSERGLEKPERIFRSKDEIGGTKTISGRMVLLSDGTLLVGVSSSFPAVAPQAQQLSSDIGKLVRINRDGSIPKDNPFVHTAGALPEIWAYGIRAPLGLCQDPSTGEIWEADGGPLGGDEINLIKRGANYGWAKTSWGFAYDGGLAAPLQVSPGVEDPILVWSPSQDPSGITRYHGSVYPQWDGDYFLGQLPAHDLVRLRIDAQHQVLVQEKMLIDLDERIRDVKEGPDRHIYLLTDGDEGRLLRLQPGRPSADQIHRVARQLQAAPDSATTPLTLGDPAVGKQAFIDRCAGCHRVGKVVEGESIGPDLAGVYGRKAGAAAGFTYSPAMAAATNTWDLGSLNQFLAGPSRYVPGTKMGAPPVTDLTERLAIIAFLKQESTERN